MGDGLANRAWRALRGAGGGGVTPGAGLIASVLNAGIALAATVSNRANQALGVAVAAVVKSATVDTKPAVSVTTSVDATSKPSVTPALAVTGSNTVTTKAATTPALALTPTVAPTVKPVVNPAAAITTRLVSGEAKAAVNPSPGVAVVGRNSQTPCHPAVNWTQITYNLTHRRGGSAQTNTGWTTPENAISGTDGRRDGLNATCTGGSLANTDVITLTYPAQANRSELAISDVRLHFFSSLASSLGSLATVTHAYSFDGTTFTTLGTRTTDHDALTTPITYDITAAVAGNWANVANLRTRATYAFAALSAATTGALDAIEVEVTASRTDLI